jgi:hypothetical protein
MFGDALEVEVGRLRARERCDGEQCGGGEQWR